MIRTLAITLALTLAVAVPSNAGRFKPILEKCLDDNRITLEVYVGRIEITAGDGVRVDSATVWIMAETHLWASDARALASELIRAAGTADSINAKYADILRTMKGK